MLKKCIDQVNAAAGRTLSQAEIAAIDDRLTGTAQAMARQDRAAWLALTPAQRTLAAAERAMQDARAEARLKLQRQQLQLIKRADVDAEIAGIQEMLGSNRSRATYEHMQGTSSYINGVRDQYWSQLRSLFDAAASSEGVSAGRRALQFLFDVENPQMTRDLAVEVFARGEGGTGNRLAVEAAKAWGTTVETMRQRFNNAGGDVGRLEYGYLPQGSDQGRVLAAGQDAWVQQTLPKLDRSRYVRPDGSLMDDAEMTAFLRATWETLSSGGLNKLEPGGFRGTGARANRGSQTRQLHWRDGQAYVEYMSEFGQGSMYDAMTSHISGLARDIGLVERYGPNPAHQFRVQADIAERQDGGPRRVEWSLLEGHWDVISGNAGAVQNASLARVAADVRNLNVASKLGRAVLASISDIPTYLLTSGYNKLPYWQALKNIGGQFSGETREFLNAHGLIAESLVSDLNRFSGDHIRNNWSGKIANSVMKLSLMNAWTDGLRRAFQMTMMGGLGKMSGKDWGALTEWDRAHMARKGITEDDWAVLRQVQPTEYRGQKYLTPESIMATGADNAPQLVSKVLGLIRDESEYAVLNPNLATRTLASGGGQQAGTVGGELSRAVMQFKSFPLAMIFRHFRRMIDAPRGLDGAPAVANRLAYGASLMLGTTIAGGIAFQIKEMLSGRDPLAVNSGRFWSEALLQGGGLSIVGDMLFQDPRETPGGFAASVGGTVLGPSAGTMFDVVGLGVENAWRAASGDDLNLGAGAARTVRGTLPYQNLWWLSGAIDHTFFHALQENLSPGYLSRVERRASRQHDQDYWWQLGPGLPERGPDLSRAWSR
ncbi:hypothetical protein [Achromobacter sp. NFACC18-2]|uniref:hypothetical protein n=1 Tax=Achromobacter sp. NFACC18-2 TaxID=1564112 RepID=UPI0008BEB041|nr:hypothetical protein [Achromobacter sp. NFACC18-2]SEI79149.1 hypothetical protein SAMN03159494_01007 [Achromobacter sp. NFACC18-2]